MWHRIARTRKTNSINFSCRKTGPVGKDDTVGGLCLGGLPVNSLSTKPRKMLTQKEKDPDEETDSSEEDKSFDGAYAEDDPED